MLPPNALGAKAPPPTEFPPKIDPPVAAAGPVEAPPNTEPPPKIDEPAAASLATAGAAAAPGAAPKTLPVACPKVLCWANIEPPVGAVAPNGLPTFGAAADAPRAAAPPPKIEAGEPLAAAAPPPKMLPVVLATGRAAAVGTVAPNTFVEAAAPTEAAAKTDASGLGMAAPPPKMLPLAAVVVVVLAPRLPNTLPNAEADVVDDAAAVAGGTVPKRLVPNALDAAGAPPKTDVGTVELVLEVVEAGEPNAGMAKRLAPVVTGAVRDG